MELTSWRKDLGSWATLERLRRSGLEGSFGRAPGAVWAVSGVLVSGWGWVGSMVFTKIKLYSPLLTFTELYSVIGLALAERGAGQRAAGHEFDEWARIDKGIGTFSSEFFIFCWNDSRWGRTRAVQGSSSS
jgi:hypothetical protein